jgi:hypothetical protein
MAFSAALIAA